MNNKPKFPDRPPTELVEQEIKIPEATQEKMDKAVTRITKEIETLHTTNPEKYDNKAFVERLIIFLIQCEPFDGKSPLFVAERLSASMNATAPKSILDRHQMRRFDAYKNQWMTRRERV